MLYDDKNLSDLKKELLQELGKTYLNKLIYQHRIEDSTDKNDEYILACLLDRVGLIVELLYNMSFEASDNAKDVQDLAKVLNKVKK